MANLCSNPTLRMHELMAFLISQRCEVIGLDVELLFEEQQTEYL